MSAPAASAPSRTGKLRRAPVYAVVSAWAVPVLILGQFALLAVVPIVVLLASAIRDARMRSMRWWVGALAVLYATPLVTWLVRPDRAPSLSKDISPLLATGIVLVALAVIVKLATRRKR